MAGSMTGGPGKNCYAPDCLTADVVDANDSVQETNETNIEADRLVQGWPNLHSIHARGRTGIQGARPGSFGPGFVVSADRAGSGLRWLSGTVDGLLVSAYRWHLANLAGGVSAVLAKVKSCAVMGLDGFIVEVEVDISPGLSSSTIVGLPDTAVQEARERVRAAIRNSGCDFPMRRITVNLAPGDLQKAGPSYDLPIAVGILISSGQVPEFDGLAVFLRELALDGSLRHTAAMLPMASVALDQRFNAVFVPAADATEASPVQGLDVIPSDNLGQLVSHLRGDTSISPYRRDGSDHGPPEDQLLGPDLSHIKGQEHAKRALEVAAAGGHNLLFPGRQAAEKHCWPGHCLR